MYCFPDPPLVHLFACSVDHLGMVPVCDMVERNGVVFDCWLIWPKLLQCSGIKVASQGNLVGDLKQETKRKLNSIPRTKT